MKKKLKNEEFEEKSKILEKKKIKKNWNLEIRHRNI